MALLGLGLGMTMQNLVLAVQNTVAQSDLGAASSTVAFFRSLGGAIGVSALGALLGHRVTDLVAVGLARLGRRPPPRTAPPAASRTSARCPAPVRAVVEDAYGDAVAARLPRRRAVRPDRAGWRSSRIKEVPLRRTLDLEVPPVAEPVGGQR